MHLFESQIKSSGQILQATSIRSHVRATRPLRAGFNDADARERGQFRHCKQIICSGQLLNNKSLMYPQFIHRLRVAWAPSSVHSRHGWETEWVRRVVLPRGIVATTTHQIGITRLKSAPTAASPPTSFLFIVCQLLSGKLGFLLRLCFSRSLPSPPLPIQGFIQPLIFRNPSVHGSYCRHGRTQEGEGGRYHQRGQRRHRSEADQRYAKLRFSAYLLQESCQIHLVGPDLTVIQSPLLLAWLLLGGANLVPQRWIQKRICCDAIVFRLQLYLGNVCQMFLCFPSACCLNCRLMNHCHTVRMILS